MRRRMPTTERRPARLTLPRRPFALLALALLAAGCERSSTTRGGDAALARVRALDWPEIRARDTLRVAAPYNSTSYFIYRGEPLGYEYELLRNFAADKELVLQLIVPKTQSRDTLFTMLADGRVDLVAARLVPTPEDSGRVAYTRELYRTNPVLVQRAAPGGAAAARLPEPVDTILKRGPAERAPQSTTVRVRLIRRPAELAGQQVTLPEESAHEYTLIELADTLTGDIQVVEVDASDEAVVREVAKGNVAYTVTDGNLAELQAGQFKNLIVQPIVGGKKKVAWAVRPGARQLLDTLNAWITDEKRGPLFDQLYRKYFVDQRGYGERAASRYLSSRTGTLSPYDSLLKAHAPRLRWDWRLLGSQMYQESRFKPTARSWAGATGLMQLMPATARQFGARSLTDPTQNVAAGVAFLEWLQRFWASRVEDEKERLKFILASYNAGAGHVEDARRLAEAKGDDPNRWDDVAYWLLQLSKAEHYTHPVVKYGFVRGLEPVTYVRVILDRFEHYKQFVTPELAARQQRGASDED